MITMGNLTRADSQGVARLFCWLMFRGPHLNKRERELLEATREAMSGREATVKVTAARVEFGTQWLISRAKVT